jgi:hypothetical protein
VALVTAPKTVKRVVGCSREWEGFRLQTALAGEQKAGDAALSANQ